MQILKSTHRALCPTALLLFLFAGASQLRLQAQDTRIAFVGNQSGSWQLYTINPDGSGMTQITNLDATDFDQWLPDFSPDGEQIVFCYGQGPSSGNAQTEIYVMNVDGTNMVQLTHDGLYDCAPRWSPDGSHIIFVRLDPVSFQTVVTTMLPDGSQMTGLTSRLWGAFRSGYSPDMQRIFYESTQAGFVSVLWAMNADGSNQTRLTPASLRAGDIAVSPDGKNIAFNNNQNSPGVLANRVFVMNVDGTHVRQITHGGAAQTHDGMPNYSPDGTKIVFTSDRMNTPGTLDLFTMNSDGSNLTRIATGITVGGCPDGNCVSPAWGRVPTISVSRTDTITPTLTGYCFGTNPAGCFQLKDPVQCPVGAAAKNPVHKIFYCPHHNPQQEYVDSSRGCQVKFRLGTVHGLCMVN